MLELIARIDNVPPMNLLFGAVKMALTPADAVAAWYPHLAGAGVRQPDDEAYAAFRAFALEHAHSLAQWKVSERRLHRRFGVGP